MFRHGLRGRGIQCIGHLDGDEWDDFAGRSVYAIRLGNRDRHGDLGSGCDEIRHCDCIDRGYIGHLGGDRDVYAKRDFDRANFGLQYKCYGHWKLQFGCDVGGEPVGCRECERFRCIYTECSGDGDDHGYVDSRRYEVWDGHCYGECCCNNYGSDGELHPECDPGNADFSVYGDCHRGWKL